MAEMRLLSRAKDLRKRKAEVSHEKSVRSLAAMSPTSAHGSPASARSKRTVAFESTPTNGHRGAGASPRGPRAPEALPPAETSRVSVCIEPPELGDWGENEDAWAAVGETAWPRSTRTTGRRHSHDGRITVTM